MDNKEHPDVSYRFGMMHADIKHILAGQENTRKDLAAIDERVTKVERSYIKIFAVAGVIAPLAMVALNIAVTVYIK